MYSSVLLGMGVRARVMLLTRSRPCWMSWRPSSTRCWASALAGMAAALKWPDRRSPAVTKLVQTSKMSGSVRRVSVLILAALEKASTWGVMPAKQGRGSKLALMVPAMRSMSRSVRAILM